MGLFGGSDEPDIEAIADKLGSRPTEGNVKRTLDELEESMDRLASAADIAGPDGRVENDAPPAEKARELATLVERGRLSIDRAGASGRSGGSTADAGDGIVSSVAEDVSRSRRPAGHRAATLLDTLASASTAGEGELREALDAAIDRLEVADDIDRALELGDPERTAGRLMSVDDDLAADVARLAETAGDRDGDAAATKLEDARAAVDRALSQVDGSQPRRDATLVERIELLDEAAAEADSPSVSDAAPGAEAARRVRANNRAECEPARDLLDGVASDDPEDVADALRQGVDALNEAATVRNLTADVDADAVAARVRSLGDSLSGSDGPVADALAERAERLEAMLERADASNAVVPYAVREEVAFYERDLLPVVQSAPSGGAGGDDVGTDDGSPAREATGDDAVAVVDALAERRQEIHTRYVDSRTDHNHSIPMFFLSLTESMEEQAREALAAEERERARGIASATEAVLERVEGLYERNEYSVMLRRLRG